MRHTELTDVLVAQPGTHLVGMAEHAFCVDMDDAAYSHVWPLLLQLNYIFVSIFVAYISCARPLLLLERAFERHAFYHVRAHGRKQSDSYCSCSHVLLLVGDALKF